MRLPRWALFFSALLVSTAARAVEISKHVHIVYGSPSWNVDSTKVDSAVIVMRDRNSGRIVQIQLDETGPDTSEFRGQFMINWTDSNKISPEIYVPPQDIRSSKEEIKSFYTAIHAGQIHRQPIIVKKADDGQRIVDVYDTKDQAARAWKAYLDALRARDHKLVKPVPSDQALDTKQLAAKERLAKKTADAEGERIRLEQIERQKEVERIKKLQALTAQQAAQRKAQAKTLAQEGLELYKKSDFKGAEEKFEKSVDLDPTDQSYYYKYGVSLYRNGKFNQALVIFKLAKTQSATDLEKKFYMGLSHYRLKDYDKAFSFFEGVSKAKDPTLSPSALFYVGLINMNNEKYEEATKNFEDVIDTSQNNPEMDNQCDRYIERLASLIKYKKIRSKRWTVTGLIGAMYDSNVLLTSDTEISQGSAENESDVRLLTYGRLEYRPVMTQYDELKADATISLTNSSQNSLAMADPWLFTFETPYVHRGTWGGEGYQLTLTPGYETLYMQFDNHPTKMDILDSVYLGIDNTFIVRHDLISSYYFEYRHDNSSVPDSADSDNADAHKFTFKSTQTYLLDKSNQQALLWNLDYVRNQAKGNNKLYNRYETGITYIKPVFWKSSWSVGLNYYLLDFPHYSTSRTDNDLTLTTGLSKPIKEWFIWGLTASFTNNKSTATEYDYSRYTVMTTATFTSIF